MLHDCVSLQLMVSMATQLGLLAFILSPALGSSGSSSGSADEDPFAQCGFGESGAPVSGSEGDSPFGVGSDTWCCGNTTWSSFSWRAVRLLELTLQMSAHGFSVSLSLSLSLSLCVCVCVCVCV